MAARPLTVFVSSTSQDLAPYRKALIDALFYMDQRMSIMERFGSHSAGAGPVSNGKVDECDVLIGIYAYRYGYVPGEENGAQGLSVTEGEFDAAQKAGLQCLCYFADPVLEAALATPEPEWKRERLKDFKARIDASLVRSTFSSPDNLTTLIVADVNRILAGDPIGFSAARMRETWSGYQHGEHVRLRDELWHRPVDLVPSPLTRAWSDYLTEVPWHRRIAASLADAQEIVRRYPQELAPLQQRLDTIDTGGTYLTVRDALQGLLDASIDGVLRRFDETQRSRTEHSGHAPAEQSAAFVTVRNALQELRREARDPHYGKCFLVIGRRGSGKTHFLDSVLVAATAAPLAEHLVLILRPTEQPPAGGVTDFEALLVHAIRAATGMRGWRSVKQFAAFIGETRLVIAFDDLAKWRVGNAQFLTILTSYIEAHSDIEGLSWLLTLETVDYDRVSETPELSRFWAAYGYNRSYRQPRPRHIGDVHFEGTAPHPALTGWLILDELNRNENVGRKILGSGLDRDGLNSSAVLQALDASGSSNRHLAIPLIVWIFLDARRQFHWSVLVNLNFIDFVGRFWEQTADSLVALAQEALAAHGERPRIVLERIVFLVAEQLAMSTELAPEFDGLVGRIVETSRGDLALKDPGIVASMLGVLERGNLVRRVRSDSLADGWPAERLELFFELFWEYRLARRLEVDIKDAIQQQSTEAAQSSLESWFGEKHVSSLREGTFEFLLLAIEQAVHGGTASQSFLVDLCRMALRSEHLPTAPVWFAGAKATPALQGRLVELARREGIGNERRALFAFMTFVGELVADVIEPEGRLALLRRHYREIGESGLDQYFVHVAAKPLQEVAADATDERLIACLHELAGSEATDRAEDVAVLAFNALVTRSNNDIPVMLATMLAYLKDSGKRASVDYQRSGRGKWERQFFREWLLQKFCRHIVWNQDAYDLLVKHHWYDAVRRHDIARHIATEMGREANLAFGALYRLRASDHPRFIAFTWRLVNSRFKVDRRNAVYIIKHSEWTAGEERVRVAKEFHPILEALFMDHDIDDTVERNYGLFSANLSDFAEREKIRKDALAARNRS